MRNNEEYKDKEINFDTLHIYWPIGELCKCGKIDLMWYDFPTIILQTEAWKATELIKNGRKYQPDIILDNRLEVSGSGFGSIATDNPRNLVATM